jgi:broad specificity phosphatase PhoE
MLLAFLVVAPLSRELSHEYYCMRHGQSLANVAGVISSDPRIACVEHGLSDEGWAQAEAAAKSVAVEAAAIGADCVAIVSSDLRRAWQTASTLRAGLLAAGVRVWPDGGLPLEERALRERSFGSLSGQSDTLYADVWVEDAKSATHEEYGCESVRSVQERGRGVVKRLEQRADLRAAASGGSKVMVVLVAHGDVLQILQTAFADVDVRAHRSLDHLPTATLRRLSGLAGGGVERDQEWAAFDDSLVSSKWRDAAGWPEI